MTKIRKHFSYANIVASLALLFAMSGGALAANHYLLNSTKQISPKILKALKGKAGPAGPAGPAGSAGAQGATGAPGAQGAKGETGGAGAKGETGGPGAKGEPGEPGPLLTTLPSGDTLRGTYTVSENSVGAGEFARGNVSFQVPLASKPAAFHVTAIGGAATAACPGSPESPEAAAGNLCVYEGKITNASGVGVFNPTSGTPGPGKLGWYARVASAAAGDTVSTGTWAVTAP